MCKYTANMLEYADEYARICGEYARIRGEYARIRESIHNEYARIRENTREYARTRRICGEDASKYSTIRSKYVGYTQGYSPNMREYATDIHSTPLRICVWSWTVGYISHGFQA